jgi:hypothetical protein
VLVITNGPSQPDHRGTNQSSILLIFDHIFIFSYCAPNGDIRDWVSLILGEPISYFLGAYSEVHPGRYWTTVDRDDCFITASFFLFHRLALLFNNSSFRIGVC